MLQSQSEDTKRVRLYRDDPEERNAAENLITLCRDCHQRWERMAEAGIRPQIDGFTAD